MHEQLLGVLPFVLTAAQRRVGEDIAHDLARAVPMHRLLQGDVGSGKTLVCFMSALKAFDAVAKSMKSSVVRIDVNGNSVAMAAIVDTNSDPKGITYVVPGNDDAGRAISLYCDLVARAVIDGISRAQGDAHGGGGHDVAAGGMDGDGQAERAGRDFGRGGGAGGDHAGLGNRDFAQ